MTKYAFLIPLILLLAGLTQTPTTIADSQDEWQWSVLDVVSTASTEYGWYPSITSDSMGNVHIAWSDNTFNLADGSDYDIFYKKWDSSTKSWGNTKSVSTESTENSFKPVIISDKLDNIHVFWYDFTDYDGSGADQDIFYKKLGKGYDIWGSTVVVSTESTGSSSIPSVAIDNLDNIHVVWYDSTNFAGAGIDNDIFYKKMDFNTQTWSVTEVLSESMGNAISPAIDCDFLGNVHVVWGEDLDGPGIIYYKKLDYSSRFWGATEEISKVSAEDSRDPVIVADYMGNIHVAWSDEGDYGGSGTDYDIFYLKWDINGQAWDTTEIVSSESAYVGNLPSMVSDEAGNIHIVWHDYSPYNNAGGDVDVFYKKKSAEETGWSTKTVIISTTPETSFFPSIAVDNSQFLHVVWHDNTNYSNSGTDYDIIYRKLSGPPQSPVLEVIEPNPSSGVVNLIWDKDWSANSYNIYRDKYPIYSVDGLESIANTSETHFVEEIEVGGTNFYAITANNPEGSTLSNTVYVTVEIEGGTITETVTEDNILTSIVTELATEYLNNTNSDEGAASFPLSVPLLLGSITLIIMIQRKRKY